MAIDSSLFIADIPASTALAVGDRIPLVIKEGPANVRAGRGPAKLKQILTLRTSSTGVAFRIHIQNANWVDEAVSIPALFTQATTLDDHSGAIQFGSDADLYPNSGWNVYAEVIKGGTTSAADTLFCLIDIDYPEVSAVVDPDALEGVPASVNYDAPAAIVNAFGAATAAGWIVKNLDYFKAGNKYCLQAVEMFADGVYAGFIAFSNAAGMEGLQRIVPIISNTYSIRYKIRYASPLVKGPMDVKLMMFAATAGTADVFTIHDYVKKGI